MPNNSIIPHKTGLADKLGNPIPLTKTEYDVEITGGLARVIVKRTFANVEKKSIEATLTFPVPIEAVMTGLTAKIGSRLLVGKSVAKEQARERYEDAISDGKSAVLHEEALKGIHILSVGHIPPGEKVVVETRWVQPLSFLKENDPQMFIPVTVGEIYGESPLDDVDDFLTDSTPQYAKVSVSCVNGTPEVNGKKVVKAIKNVLLNRALNIHVRDWIPSPVSGAISGRGIKIDVHPAIKKSGNVNIAVLIDTSSSMAGGKYQNVIKGLRSASKKMDGNDQVSVWSFENRCYFICETKGNSLHKVLDLIPEPCGGTRIGAALREVVDSGVTDIIVITDGQSHDVVPHEFSKTEARISFVLVGHESLASAPGHISSITGGQLFAVAPNDSSNAIIRAIDMSRTTHSLPAVGDDFSFSKFEKLDFLKSGAMISISSGKKSSGTDDYGAYVAGLVIGRMSQENATKLAVEAGIVSSETSLVLVDDAGEMQSTIANHRKVPLVSALPLMASGQPGGMLRSMSMSMVSDVRMDFVARERQSFGGGYYDSNAIPGSGVSDWSNGMTDLSSLGRSEIEWWNSMSKNTIPWGEMAEDLVNGNIDGLSQLNKIKVMALSNKSECIDLARELGVSTVRVAIGILAVQNGSKHAIRVASKIANIDKLRSVIALV